jgi:nicotinate phosphoribosyltransferase
VRRRSCPTLPSPPPHSPPPILTPRLPLPPAADAASVFDLFFRTNPFKGEFTVFAGLEEALKLLSTFRFSASDIAYLRTAMPSAEEGFWPWLAALDCSAVRLYAVAEGTVVFPREPLLRVEGPLAVCQLLETTLLNLCNFASLVTTNAARMRLAAGVDATVLEFGLRRAQGPDGAMSASRYAFMGGCDATSNVAAGKAFGVPIRGTHAHSMVCAYTSLEDLSTRMLGDKDIVALALKYREELGFHIASKGEMAAFIAFAQAFPKNLLCLVDTYDTLNSGVPNYICVALALLECGYEPRGIRLDSGDLAYLSKEARKLMACVYGLRRVGRPPHPLSVLASTTLPPSPRAAPRTPSTARSWRRATLWRATTSTRRCC